jgi:nucleoside-diphosphate-sugar epimerase
VAAEKKREKFLITGGQGFIGAWAARQLLREGTEFAILDRAPDDAILAQLLPPDSLAGLERYYGDIADTALVASAIVESSATRLIHLAGLQVPACRADPVAGARVNVLGTLNIFEGARRSGRIESVVYASSAAVAGDPADYPGAIADDAHHLPRTHYGVFKAANEGNARVYFLEAGIPSVGLRPLAVYGVGREIGITSGPTKAIKAAVLGRPYSIGFSGTTGFGYVEDVAAVFIGCARAAPRGALALNLRGELASVEEFIALLLKEEPAARGLISSKGPPLPVACRFQEEGLERLLGSGNVPRTPLAQGIRATLGIFRGLAREGRLHDRDLLA